MIFQASFYKSKKLLLIEDCEPVRASIKGMLQQIGFVDITAVADAVQALSPAKRHAYDFILADFNLGDGKDALQLFAELSAQDAIKPGCCFVVISAEPQRLPVMGLLQGTPDHFVLKPFSYLELEKRLAKAWQSRVALRKVYQAMPAGDLVAVHTELDEVIKNAPAYTLLALRLKGEVLLAQREYNAAMQLYKKIQQQRDFSWTRLGAAIAMVKLQQWPEAEQLLLSLTEADDVRPEALDWLSRLYLLQGALPQALEQLTELVKLQPTNIDAQTAIASVMQLSGQDDDALRYRQKLIQQFRFSGFDRADYYLELTRLLLAQASQTELAGFNAALKKCSEALASMPQKLLTDETEPEVLALRARISLLQGHIADAKQLTDELQIKEDAAVGSVGCLVDKIRLMFALGELKQAERYLTQLKALPTEQDDLHSCCQRLSAARALQQDSKLRSDIRDWNQAGMAAAQSGNVKAALLQLRLAFLSMPCNAGLALNLLQTLTQLPAHRGLQALAKAVLAALEQSNLTSANQQRLEQLLTQLPPLYTE